MAAMDEPGPASDAVAAAAAARFGSGERAIVPTMNLEKGDYEVLKAAFLAQPILFFLQRSMNSNTVCYCANLGPDGALDAKAPVEVKWVNYENISDATGLPIEEGLLFIERPVYGVDTKPGKVGGFVITVRALKKVRIAVSIREGDSTLSASATVNGVEGCEVLRIWVETRANLIGYPSVVHVDVYARASDGEVVTERHLP